DVTHDSHYRSAADTIVIDFQLLDFVSGFLFVAHLVGGRSEVASQFFGELYVQSLVDGGENLLVKEALHHDVALDAELLGKLFYRDAFRDGNFAIDGRRLKRLILPRHRAETALFGFLLSPAIARPGFRRMPAAWIGRQRSRFGPQRRRR